MITTKQGQADESVQTLGQFIPLSYGKGLPQRRRNSEGATPVYGSNGVVGHHDTPLTSGPTIVLGRKGTVGAVHFSPGPAWPIDTTFFHTEADPVLARFKYYLLMSLNLNDMNTDSAVPGLNRDAAHAVQVRVPSLSDQRAISHILGTLDDKIELNRRMSRTLEKMARALFKSWFVDFDPIRAKISGRWRSGQSLPGLPAYLYSLFPDCLVHSTIGNIPCGWTVTTVNDDFQLTMGQSPPGSTYNKSHNGLPFYQGSSDFTFRYPRRRVFCTKPTRTGMPSDTLVSVRAPVGDINMALEECAIGRGVAAVLHNSGSSSYTYYFMQHLRQRLQLFDDEGTVFGSITRRDFNTIACHAPPTTIIIAFEQIVSTIDSQIRSHEDEFFDLIQMRDNLVDKLISR